MKRVEAEYRKENIPPVEIGDLVKAGIRVIEGRKERIQVFEGVVIGLKGEGINLNVTIRKVSFGIGVEKTIPLHSPQLASLTIERKSKVRRAKLYYLRNQKGRKATQLRMRPQS